MHNHIVENVCINEIFACEFFEHICAPQNETRAIISQFKIEMKYKAKHC